MVHKWITEKKEKSQSYRIFDAYWLERRHPEREKSSNFVMIDSPNWVNIVPVTKNNEIVMVKQYRHGVDDFTLEIPGGMVDKDEDSADAAKRECIEETGWSSDSDAIYIGKNYPNPAFMNNTCYSYLWKDCEKRSEQNLDSNEEIEVVLLPISELKSYINSFKIQNALVLTGLMFFLLNGGME